MNYFEAPENMKYHGGYDPSNPPDYDEEEDLGEGETAGEDVVCAASPAPSLLLRYPVWDMTFSEYGERNGWEVPL